MLKKHTKSRLLRILLYLPLLFFSVNSHAQFDFLNFIQKEFSGDFRKIDDREYVLYKAKTLFLEKYNQQLKKNEKSINVKELAVMKLSADIERYEEQDLLDGHSKIILAYVKGEYLDATERKAYFHYFLPIIKQAEMGFGHVGFHYKVWNDSHNCYGDSGGDDKEFDCPEKKDYATNFFSIDWLNNISRSL